MITLLKVSSDMRETLVKPTWMEALSVNSGNGQSYGYIVYRSIADEF